MISIYLNGRLGNQIFQYVALRILSKKNGSNFYIPSDKESGNFFYKNCSLKFSKYLEQSVESNPHFWIGQNIFDIEFGKIDDYLDKYKEEHELVNFSVDDGTFLQGFFQNEQNLIQEEDYIRNILKIRKESDRVENFTKQYPPDEWCYVHFRGGDYKTIPKWYLPIDYYHQAMNKIKKEYDIEKFVFITDDYDECFNFFPDFPITSSTMEDDFFKVYNSVYTIIPNSSFSWWASWLKTKNIITVAPNKWFNYNKKSEEFEPKGIKSIKFNYI